jgi:histidyl-tRNA synthetase
VVAQVGRPRKIKYQSPRGMHDILPGDQKYYQKILDVCAEIADFYNFGRIETPVLERAELFAKGMGQNTDVVEKQMYVLKTKGGDTLALRPEYTASVARAFIEKGMETRPRPVKLWYFGPCFRHDRPQAGRYRQFYHLGFEILAERSPVVDIQIIQIILNILKKLKIKNLLLQINSVGDPRCQARYKKVLTRFLKSYEKTLCADCRRRIKHNPLRVLDCKNENCQNIIAQGPQIVDYLCKNCRTHFKEVLEFLDVLDIPYRLNPYLVRGLDYYTRTVFEVFIANPSDDLDSSQIALAGGGRYDGLVKLLGGGNVSACGAAAGVERIIEVMKEQRFKFRMRKKPQIFLAQLGDLGKKRALVLLEKFRKARISIYETFGKDSLRAQLNRANKLGVKYTLILGQKEVLEDKIIIRDMKKGTQKVTGLKGIVKKIKKKLK